MFKQDVSVYSYDVDLSLIGPSRRERTRVGAQSGAGFWLTLADLVGAGVGIAVAAVLILALLL